MIKLSDYVFKFIKEKSIKHIFMLPGGGAMHLVDSLGNSGIQYVCMQHEQAAACAAEAYGQHTNDIGVVLVTAGPGGTNTLTGVAAGWIDSTPMMILSGQAKRADLVGDRGVRQIGSQEVQIIDMVKPITKYAVQVLEPEKIRYYLEKAYSEATTGRMGPVWLDIPLDVQASMVDESTMEGYEPKQFTELEIYKEIIQVLELIEQAEKPLVLAGNGIKSAQAEELLYSFLERTHIPVLTTWKSMDMFSEDYPLYVGHPGSMGERGSNFILQEADFLLVIGSRLDSSITAFNEGNFAKNAKKVIADIDINEINKLNMDIEVKLQCDARRLLEKLNEKMPDEVCYNRDKWLEHCRQLREQYPVVTSKHKDMEDYVSAYYFIDELSNLLTPEDVIVPESSGGAAEITCQSFRIKLGQKMKHAAGLGSMGFGLPYSIGSCLANEGKRTILINGDGAFQLNIQELETLHRLQLPIKIFIYNNGGYASIRAMQRNTFEGHYVASSEESGLSMPDICKIANAYGIKTYKVRLNEEMKKILPLVLEEKGPCLCELYTSPDETVSPRVKTMKKEDGTLVSSELENMWPFLES